MTVSVFLSTWVDLRVPSLAPRTVESYRALIRLHISPFIGFISWRKLRPRHIAPFLAAVADAGKPRTAQLCFALLRAAYRTAVDARKIDKSPISRAFYPRHRSALPRFWTVSQLRAFIGAQPDDVYRVAWVLALCCGLRRGELCGLRWRDLDLDAGVMLVCNQRVAVSGVGIVDCSPKSVSGSRRIPLPDVVCNVLTRHFLIQQADFVSNGFPCAVYVLSVNGLGLSPYALNRRFSTALARSDGVPRITLHGLRHSMAALSVSLGVNLKVVQSLLGHSDIAITARYYAHVVSDSQRDAVAKIANSVL